MNASRISSGSRRDSRELLPTTLVLWFPDGIPRPSYHEESLVRHGPHGFNIPIAMRAAEQGLGPTRGYESPPRGLPEDFRATLAASARQDATSILYEVVAR